jgi:signal transduction histidine kinase
VEKGTTELVVGDPMRLKQILINILINSINSSESGDIVLCLKNVVKEGKFMTEFTLTMSHAINSEQLQNIFVPFSNVTVLGDGGKKL